jgi:alpha-beta hydrolase superfamily lysophospholipase
MDINVTERTLPFEGYTIHITKIQTKPSGKTAVYLHGMCMHSAFYHGLTELLPDDFAHFYFIDLPNHGRSTGTKGFLPSPDILLNAVDVAISTIKQQDGLTRIDLVSAESMGGIVALYYLLKRDSESSSRYLIFGAPVYPNWSFFFTDLQQPLSTYCALFAKNRLVLPVKTLLGDMTHNRDVYGEILKDPLVPDSANMNYLFILLGMIREIQAGYDRIGKDILFFYGEKDAISNVGKITKRHRSIRNFRTIVVPGERHSIFWADKENYQAPIQAWLAETST